MLASQFINSVEKSLTNLLNQLDSIKKAAEKITRTVTGGNKVFVVDRYGIIDTELVDRASGLALFRSLKYDSSKLSKGDVLIISAYHPEDEYDLFHLNWAHSLGAAVISISPEGKLAQGADISLLNIDNGQNGVITVSGIARKFCPASGIENAALAWMLTAETTALLMAQEKTPTVYRGNYLVDGRAKLIEARKRFSSLGY